MTQEFDAQATNVIPEYADNMFIERLPAILGLKQLQASFDRPPLLSEHDRARPPEERLHIVLRLLRFSQPTVAARELGRRIEQMILQGYIGRNPNTSDWMRFAQTCGLREATVKAARSGAAPVLPADALGNLVPVSDTSISTLVAGPPGAGKTHSVETALLRYKQVIYHTAPFVLAQIVWLRVECPPNGSLVSLCRFFFAAVDTALNRAGIESNLVDQYKTASLAVLLVGMARVANLHGIGMLVIDEIQHVKVAHSEGSTLLNFLVTLRNSIGIPLLLVGTMSALRVVQRTFRDARRADGLGSILFDRLGPAEVLAVEQDEAKAEDTEGDSPKPPQPIYGPEFYDFMKRMWRWQYLKIDTELSVPVLNAMYEETQGVIDLVIKLFVLIQMQLINITAAKPSNVEQITPVLIQQVAARSFNAVRPFIKALRENNQDAIALHEDLLNFNEWFSNYIAGVGMAELNPSNDADHGSPGLPPMTVSGSIDSRVADGVMDGFKIPPKDRAAILSRHGALIENGDISGFVEAISRDQLAHQARKDRSPPRVKAPPIDGDLRAVLEGCTDPSEAAKLLGPASLSEALD